MTHHRHKHSDPNAPADETPLTGDATTQAPPPGAPAGQPTDQPAAVPAAAPAPTANNQALQAERDDLLARLQRLSADYVNYQRRAAREMADACEFANAKLLRDLLPVLDDLERTMLAAAADHGEDDPFYMGVQLVHGKMLEVLKRYGVERIEAAGKPFDPAYHAAMMQQESADVAPGTVLKDYVRGFLLKGRTIRPAGVIVAKAPEQKDGDEEISTDD